MRHIYVIFLLSLSAFAQSDRGTITGTIADPTSAVIAKASISARNTETGSQYETVATGTGNYTISQLPAGNYELDVQAPGFTKFTQQGIRVQVAQSARIDITLRLGEARDTVTVTADATLLKTENAEQSTTMPSSRINSLPLGFSGSVRNPLDFAQLTPGTTRPPGANSPEFVNGTPASSFKVMFEGQDTTSSIDPAQEPQQQPSVEAVEEFTLQTSNFSAEYGQVAGGLFNFTAKSGTNHFHGSGFEYFANEDLNAGQPFTSSGQGHLLRPRNRRNSFGGTVGGPVLIPRLYNGRDRTFFFFNYETYRSTALNSGNYATVPTDAMRNGDFSAILTGRTLGTDSLGRPIPENAIYDPASGRQVSGLTVTDPFPGNTFPKSRMDPVALKIQALIPAPTRAGLVNNFLQTYPTERIQVIPSVKLDHILSPNSRLSFYYSHEGSESYAGADGLPSPVTALRILHVTSDTSRLNYDQTITPTFVLHAGIGYLTLYDPDVALPSVLAYDAAGQLGLTGGTTPGFPRLAGLGNAFGGMSLGIGPTNANNYYNNKPTAVLSATYVRGNHTLKAGVDVHIDTWTDRNTRGTTGIFNFTAVETGLPSTLGQNLQGGTIGFPYASFLLGLANNGSVQTPQDPQLRKNSWALFVQDNWKITRKLTLDYGLRWDLEQAPHELHDRLAVFDPHVANPAAGGLPGGTSYAGYGPGRCNCSLTSTYPYGIGPRLGVAYQIDSKTVLRAGWGITYGTTSNYNFVTNTPIVGVGNYNQLLFTSPTYGSPSIVLRNGLPYTQAQLYDQLDPGIRPSPGQLNAPPYLIDRNGGRPPRINQWSVGIQREIVKDIVVEAAYVGNRGVWEQGNSLVDLNALSPQRLASFGLDINNASDRAVLTSPLSSAQVTARGFKAPYAGFPLTATLAQALRPFPQFTSVSVLWAPVGNSWYDSLQTKVTKRYSHGLDVTAAFTWQKSFNIGAQTNSAGGTEPVNDVFNRRNSRAIATNDQPFVLATSFAWQIPALGTNRWMRAAVRDWTLSGILQYASGLPILSPYSNNSLNALLLRNANGGTAATFANRVPGQPLFLQDLNCHCFDPGTAFVLNPKAWTDPAPGQWGTAAPYYTDYRQERRPSETMSLGRIFRIRESMSFQLRAEFFNVFNRTYLNNPTSTNAAATQVRNGAGQATSGFGWVNTGSTFSSPRTGQLVARFQW